MAYDADAADTIEWGDHEGRSRGGGPDGGRPDSGGAGGSGPGGGSDGLLPGQAALTAVVDAAGPEGRGGLLRRFNPYALGCALGGFIALLGAQYLPWAHVNAAGASQISPGATEVDLNLAQFNPWMALCYHLTLPLVLAAVSTTLVAAPGTRRAAAAIAVGLAGGQLALLVTIARDIQAGSVQNQVPPPNVVDPVSFGPGFSIAALATLLFIAAAILALRPRRPRTAEPVAEPDEAAPIDLTVSQVEPTTHWEATR